MFFFLYANAKKTAENDGADIKKGIVGYSNPFFFAKTL